MAKKTTKKVCSTPNLDPMAKKFGEYMYVGNKALSLADPNKLVEKTTKLQCELGVEKSKVSRKEKNLAKKGCLCGLEKAKQDDLKSE